MMRGRVKQCIIAAAAVLSAFVSAVPAYADIAYDPIETLIYGLGPILLTLIIVMFAVSLIAGIVLLIIFSVRRKKRRAAEEKKNGEA